MFVNLLFHVEGRLPVTQFQLQFLAAEISDGEVTHGFITIRTCKLEIMNAHFSS